MEKRWSPRILDASDVLLYHDNIPVVSCKTHDVSLDGLFVASGPLTYRIDTIVKIEFQLDSDTGTDTHLLTAMVVRHSQDGLGFMLPGDDSEAMKAWHRKVKSTAIQQPAKQIETKLTKNNSLDSPVGNRKGSRL